MVYHVIYLLVIAVLALLSVYFYRKCVAWEKSVSELRKEISETRAIHCDSVNSVDSLISMLMGIHEFGLKHTSLKTKQELVKAILDYAMKLLKTNSGSLMLLDNSTSELVIVASSGIPEDIVKKTRLKIGEGIAGLVARDAKPIFVEDIDSDPRFFKTENVVYPAKSFMCVPLQVKDQVIGVLNVNRRKDEPKFSERDLRLLMLLAGQSAITIENLELYQNLQQLYLETMQTLAKAIDAKDAYTREHADRSAYYAKAVAEELRLPKSMIKNIEYAAMMHDIGKIGIKEEILLKRGHLTPEEKEEIKKHPSIGEKIIAPIEFLAPIAPLILYHHEWFNGGGYTEGLAGEEIPIGARIVAVIDAYDAMTSDRPYRKALPMEVAIKELQKGAGTQFDPKIVDALIRVLDRESKTKE